MNSSIVHIIFSSFDEANNGAVTDFLIILDRLQVYLQVFPHDSRSKLFQS